MWFQNVVGKAARAVKRLVQGGRVSEVPVVKVPSPKGPYKRSKEQEGAAEAKQVKVSRAMRRHMARNPRKVSFKVRVTHGRAMVKCKWWPEIGSGQVVTHDPETGVVTVAFPFLGAHRDRDGRWHGRRLGFKKLHWSELAAA